jgi:hypothetical protein
MLKFHDVVTLIVEIFLAEYYIALHYTIFKRSHHLGVQYFKRCSSNETIFLTRVYLDLFQCFYISQHSTYELHCFCINIGVFEFYDTISENLEIISLLDSFIMIAID